MRLWRPLNGVLVALLVAGAVGAVVIPGGGGEAPVSGLPPLGQPSCVPGAVNVTTAGAVVSNLQADNDVCVTAAITASVMLDQNMGSTSMEHLGTQGAGSMGYIEVDGANDLTIRARFRSIRIDDSEDVIIEQSVIGGTQSERTLDNLVQLVDTLSGTNRVIVRDNDIGWTCADNGGNTGFGIRAYGDNHNLLIQRNKIHDLAADGVQGTSGDNVVVDRNEIGPVGNCPGSEEHSDQIQVTGTADLTITNNWIHHNGCFDGACPDNAGTTYIHGGSSGILFENNLMTENRGRMEVCNLGSGGTAASDITIRRNTFYDSGQAGLGGLEWDCDTGTGNLIDRNVMVDAQGGFTQSGNAGTVTLSNNITGQLNAVTVDGDWNCTSSNCNPAGQDPIGFRKPSGVHW